MLAFAWKGIGFLSRESGRQGGVAVFFLRGVARRSGSENPYIHPMMGGCISLERWEVSVDGKTTIIFTHAWLGIW